MVVGPDADPTTLIIPQIRLLHSYIALHCLTLIHDHRGMYGPLTKFIDIGSLEFKRIKDQFPIEQSSVKCIEKYLKYEINLEENVSS